MRCLPGPTPPTLTQYGFRVDLSITKIRLWVSVILKTCPGLPFAYRTTPNLLNLVYVALHDLAPHFSPFLFLPEPPYPLCLGPAKWLPDPLVDSAVSLRRLHSWFASSEHSVPYCSIKQTLTHLLRQRLNITSSVSPFWSLPWAEWTILCFASSVCSGWMSSISPLPFYGTSQFTWILPWSLVTLSDSHLLPIT